MTKQTTKTKATDIQLKIVGYDESIDKPDKDGFQLIRFFTKQKGDYKITYWNDRLSNPVLWKTTKDYQRYIPIRNDTVADLKNGKTILVDNDILSI